MNDNFSNSVTAVSGTARNKKKGKQNEYKGG